MKNGNRGIRRTVVVNDRMQQGYRYELVRPMGRGFDLGFRPQLTPKQMLRLGVFGEKYLTDCTGEFPADWFARAKLCPARHAAELNFFQVNASLPLSQWKRKGWIYKDDPRGWFQWYCRYYMGRRIDGEDDRQIARWKAMKRHVAQPRRVCSSAAHGTRAAGRDCVGIGCTRYKPRALQAGWEAVATAAAGFRVQIEYDLHTLLTAMGGHGNSLAPADAAAWGRRYRPCRGVGRPRGCRRRTDPTKLPGYDLAVTAP